MSDIHTRKGTFTIPRSLIDTNPNMMLEVGAACIVVEARANFMDDTVTYWAYSRRFRSVPEGMKAVEYTIMNDYKDGVTNWKFKEIK